MKLKCALAIAVTLSAAQARVGNFGNRPQVNVQNRTTNQRINQNVNRNTNVNQNVNVNRNVNLNRNVNVNTYGGYGGVVVHDNDWNWGSFAAGAAAGVVTGAVVGAATSHSSTTVVTTPAPVAIGTTLNALPGGCSVVAGAAGTIYNCANTYYRPYYQGTTLVYQCVKYP